MPKTFADVVHTRELLGWEPTTPITVGIPRFVEWYRQYYSASTAAA